MKKTISILGSTGSIGQSTFEIIDKKRNYFKIILLSSNKNFSVICKQIKRYKPKYFVIRDLKVFNKVKKKFKNSKVKIINKLDNNNIKKNDIKDMFKEMAFKKNRMTNKKCLKEIYVF